MLDFVVEEDVLEAWVEPYRSRNVIINFVEDLCFVIYVFDICVFNKPLSAWQNLLTRVVV